MSVQLLLFTCWIFSPNLITVAQIESNKSEYIQTRYESVGIIRLKSYFGIQIYFPLLILCFKIVEILLFFCHIFNFETMPLKIKHSVHEAKTNNVESKQPDVAEDVIQNSNEETT
ncbi:hypothetical protein RF11_05009 [Thelohanellus kitauei]|uniref:Uncharacterized protein n=1 Tax=Thelohanellus kitauei TaxID=669202 RepID=A0A0C2MBX5_THEKT|nr:hypothetical protein RF11_05009 [Thelohanellus kitauei]